MLYGEEGINFLCYRKIDKSLLTNLIAQTWL